MNNQVIEMQPGDTSSTPSAAPTSTAAAPTITAPATTTIAEATASPAPAPGISGAAEAPAATPPASEAHQPGNPVPPSTTKPTVSELLGLPPTDREILDDAAVAEDTVLLAYQLVLRGGREEVVRVKSQLVLPMALALENLPQTDVSFPELFDQVIVRPLVAKFRAFLQRRFDAASRTEAEAKAAPVEAPFQPAFSMNVKPTKPTNGASFVMPEIDAKPPLPQRPGSRVWAAGTNGM